jgi:hypothetical protein
VPRAIAIAVSALCLLSAASGTALAHNMWG